MTQSKSRELVLLAAVAAWGLAVGITLATLTVQGPPPRQIPSALSTLHGIDARAPLRAILLVIAGPILAALLARPYVRRVAGNAERWAIVAIAAALLTGLWVALLDPFDTLIILFVPLVGAVAFALLRHVDPRFDRGDIILLPIFLTLFAIAGLWMTVAHAALLAAAITVGVRLAVRLPQPRRLIAYVIYPLFAIALFAGDLTPRVNLFEDGHSLTPASEMLHGERPYRDIVPGHGLVADSLLDWAAMHLGARDIGDVLRVRAVAAALLPAAVYFVALAATGSAEAAILAFLFAASLTITGTPWARPVSAIEAMPGFRPIPSLLALAACAYALRMRSRRWLAIAGGLAVLAELTSVEFGFYAIVICIVTVLRASATWRGRRSALLAVLSGAAIVAVPAALIMLVRGWLGAYLHTMLVELPPLSEAYSILLFHFPDAYKDLSTFPEIIAALFIPRTVWFVLWCLIATGTAIGLTQRAGGRRLEPILILGMWTVAAALSFAERTNVYFLATAAICVVAVVSAAPTLRWVAVVILILMAAPTPRLITLAAKLRNRGNVAGYVRYDALPRARGGWFEPDNARRLAAAQAFIDRALRPGETFFDFANMPILYYLFDRRCPVRQYETPFYETEELQREVIARLESDRSVRAALMQFPNQGFVAIDGVPNAIRAPLVAQYLRDHFAPAYARDGVVFWLRRQ
jgi:hypothetical protein